MKFSSLFENKLTLDNLDYPQLTALCKLIGISSIGPDYYLRFILELKLRHLAADDKLIDSEGIENLTVEELQAACRDRGMRSHGLSVERLHSQLEQWLDLHLNKRIPSTLLLLSRALYLPENVSQENILKATIQSLSKAIDNVTAIKLAKASGERVDNTQRIEYIKHEDQAIRKEREEKNKAIILSENEKKKGKVTFIQSLYFPKNEKLPDNASVLYDMTNDEKKDEHIDVGQFEAVLKQLLHLKSQEIRHTAEEIRDLTVNLRQSYINSIKHCFYFLD